MPTSRQLCIITHTLRRPGGRRGPCEARRGLLWRGWTDAVVPRLAGWVAERCHRHCQPHIHPSAEGIRRGRSGSPGLLAACLGAAIAVHPGGRTAPSHAYAPRHYAAPRARCKDWRFNGVHSTRATLPRSAAKRACLVICAPLSTGTTAYAHAGWVGPAPRRGATRERAALRALELPPMLRPHMGAEGVWWVTAVVEMEQTSQTVSIGMC